MMSLGALLLLFLAFRVFGRRGRGGMGRVAFSQGGPGPGAPGGQPYPGAPPCRAIRSILAGRPRHRIKARRVRRPTRVRRPIRVGSRRKAGNRTTADSRRKAGNRTTAGSPIRVDNLRKAGNRSRHKVGSRTRAGRRQSSRAKMATKTILVVDDEPGIVTVVRDYLDRAGFRVLTAGDGATALRLARAERPSLLVLDLMLPGMDGLDVTRALRAGPGHAHTADHHAHGAGRGGRPADRPGTGRRRLHHQAVQPARAGGARARRAAPRRGRPRSYSGVLRAGDADDRPGAAQRAPAMARRSS